MDNLISYIIVENADKSIITCPQKDLKENPWLFDKPKVLAKYDLFDGYEHESHALAFYFHKCYIRSEFSPEFLKALNNTAFNSTVEWKVRKNSITKARDIR